MSETRTELQLQLAEWGTAYLGTGRAGLRELCMMYGQDPIFAMLVAESFPVILYGRTPDLELPVDHEVSRFVLSHNLIAGEDYTLVACVGGEARSLWLPTIISQSPGYKGNLFNHLFYPIGFPIERPVRRGISWSNLEQLAQTSQLVNGKLHFECPLSLELIAIDTLVVALDFSAEKAQVAVRMIILLLQVLSERHRNKQKNPLNILISAGNEDRHRQYAYWYNRYAGLISK